MSHGILELARLWNCEGVLHAWHETCISARCGLLGRTLSFPPSRTVPRSPRQIFRIEQTCCSAKPKAAMSPNGAIERILEVSAEAQIKRREAAEDSPAFHNLTGAIIAYGKALGLLSKLKEVRQLSNLLTSGTTSSARSRSDACGYSNSGNHSDFPRLAGGTIPFIRKYSTICP